MSPKYNHKYPHIRKAVEKLTFVDKKVMWRWDRKRFYDTGLGYWSGHRARNVSNHLKLEEARSEFSPRISGKSVALTTP